jgi:pentose-5-phosphate-3-epimerase
VSYANWGLGPPWRSNPATPIEPYEDLLPELDMVLIMTVEPGFGGQSFLDMCLPKITEREPCWTSLVVISGCRSTAVSQPRRSNAAQRQGVDSFVGRLISFRRRGSRRRGDQAARTRRCSYLTLATA